MSAPVNAAPALLRLATAGSVDDGKSTLVGRLLYDTKSVLADQIDAVTRASVDKGLDTPGHVQYTRNTVSGASTAQVVILLTDARKGVIEQTRRHAAVLSLLGVPRLVLAVNKIDLVENPATVFQEISTEFRELTRSLGWSDEAVHAIPVSALHGDNVASRSDATPYYDGPSLIEHLESIPTDPDTKPIGFRFPVQYVIRPRTPEYPDYRGYAGQVAAGTVDVGDEVLVLPAGTRSRVERIDTADGELASAHTGRSVTVILADDVDVSRGDVIASATDAPEPRQQFEATVCWLAEKPLRIGSRLLLKHGTKTTQAIVGGVDAVFDEQNLQVVPGDGLELNQIGRIAIQTAEPIVADDYDTNREMGSFLLIDPAGGNTLAAGLVGNALSHLE